MWFLSQQSGNMEVISDKSDANPYLGNKLFAKIK